MQKLYLSSICIFNRKAEYSRQPMTEKMSLTVTIVSVANEFARACEKI